MPYQNASDPSLPPHIKKLPLSKRRQWVAVFNSSFQQYHNEGRAMAAANSAAKEVVGMVQTRAGALLPVQCPCGHTVEVEQGAKQLDCSLCETSRSLVWAEKDGSYAAECGPSLPYRPYGGAVSFDEVDAKREANRWGDHVDLVKRIFDGIWTNIWESDVEISGEDATMDQKLGLVRKAVADMVARIEAGPDSMKEVKSNGHTTILDRLRGLFSGSEIKEINDRILSLKQSYSEDDERKKPKKKEEGAKQQIKQEDGKAFHASDYADVGDAAKPATWKLRLGSTPGAVDTTHIAGAITAMQPGGFRGNRVALMSAKAKVVSRISGAINRLAAPDATKKNLRDRLSKVKEVGDSEPSAFFVTKDVATQRPRWVSVVTNNFEDREKEWFSEAAHKEFEQYLDAHPDAYPELWFWHIPGSKIGKADYWAYSDGFVIASGLFDTGMEDVAQRLKDYPEPLGTSHGFRYLRDPQNKQVYARYRTREITALPLRKAANAWTAFAASLKEVFEDMTMADEKRAALALALGEERADKIISGVSDLSQTLKENGVSFKDLSAVFDETSQGNGNGNGNGNGEEEDAASGDEQSPTETPPSGEPSGGDAPTDAPPSGDETPPPGEGAAGKSAALDIAALAKAVSEAIMPALDAKINEKLDPLAAQVKELRKDDDEKIADAMRPQRVVPVTPPSADDRNLVDDSKAKSLKDGQETDADGKPRHIVDKYLQGVVPGA